MTVIPKPHTIVKGRRNSQGLFYLGDCLDVFKNIEPQSVDVIVTSPPV